MEKTKHNLNELLVGLFNYILYIEEKNLKKNGVTISMNDVHVLENIEKSSDNSMSHIAQRLMITQGTLTTNVSKLIKKGYVIRYKDDNDKRVVRLKNTEKAQEVLKIHEDFHTSMIDKTISGLGLDKNEAINEALENMLAFFREEFSD